MKSLSFISLFFFFIFCFNDSHAVVKEAANGLWNDPDIWTPVGVPTSTDIINIPVGVTVQIIGDVDLRDSPTITVINVYGTLEFLVIGRIRLDLGDPDVINVFAGGEINADSAIFGVLDFGGELVFITPGSPIDTPTSISDGIETPLPIELISFNAELSGEVVNISWATASETNNDFFTLERSDEGVNWSVIGEVTGAGTTTIRNDYEYLDHNPIPGLSYYKLKQTDYDGQFEYFTPVVVLYEPDNLFKVFPNPTIDILQISTSSDLSNAAIFVKNLNGQTERIEIDASSHQATLDISHLPTGVYLLEIVFSESVLSKKIIKK